MMAHAADGHGAGIGQTLRRALAPVPTLAAVVVIAVTCALGNWQLRRAHDKTARAERVAAMASAPALSVGGAAAGESVIGRRVRVTGRFDAAHTVLLDNRPHPGAAGESRAGFLVLTPLVPASGPEGATAPSQPPARDGNGRAVLVVRGWLPRDAQDRTRIAPFPTPDGEVTIEGLALAAVPRVYALGNADAEHGQRIRQNVDLAGLSTELGRPLQPFVLEQHSDGGDGLARDWPAPDDGAQRNLGYAFQWFGLAALTAVLLIVFGWRRARRPGQGRLTGADRSGDVPR